MHTSLLNAHCFLEYTDYLYNGLLFWNADGRAVLRDDIDTLELVALVPR